MQITLSFYKYNINIYKHHLYIFCFWSYPPNSLSLISFISYNFEQGPQNILIRASLQGDSSIWYLLRSFLLFESVKRHRHSKNSSTQHASKQVLSPVVAIAVGYIQNEKHKGQHKQQQLQPIIGLSQFFPYNCPGGPYYGCCWFYIFYPCGTP